VPDFMSIGQAVMRYGDFSIFQNGSRLPSWICCRQVLTTKKSIWWSLSLCTILLESMHRFWLYASFSISPVRPENAYWRPEMGFL